MSHLDTNYGMNTDYPQRQQQQQQWPPHLLAQPTDHQHYPPFFDRASRGSSLSLNLSSLSVASPSNPSPINPSPGASSALSPSTPISPAGNPFNPHIQPTFQFDASQPPQSSPVHYTDEPILPPPPSSGGSTSSTSPYDNRRTPGPSRSSSATSSSSHLPRKRSFTSTPVLEESAMYDEARDAPMDLASSSQQPYDDIDMRFGPPSAGGATNNSGSATGNGSPVEGSGSSGAEDPAQGGGGGGVPGVGGSMTVLGKPMATNNFVTKLYQSVSLAFLIIFWLDVVGWGERVTAGF
ncbi:hypothetical protein D9615_006503 [Tricholomella constricta]|uniref:Uncharacterized protein n=1 Tax=Tricholomella constricta TaxID=117010 RepID=A0A8H5M3J2_9AGAR|nr:hypothetical protein D9615_006503 [Tricholomella constricta]